jgi:hypothetical protein
MARGMLYAHTGQFAIKGIFLFRYPYKHPKIIVAFIQVAIYYTHSFVRLDLAAHYGSSPYVFDAN